MHKLGKLQKRHDPRTLRFAKYLQAWNLPPIPDVCDWGAKVSAWGMMGNDNAGDCTCAAAGHLILEWTANDSKPFMPTDEQIIEAYSAITGYNPKTGLNDNGAAELDVLKYWLGKGIAGRKISAFVALQENNAVHLKSACYLFGGAYIGLQLPTTTQGQDVWDVVPGMEVGSWGGHAVPIIGYNPVGPVCVTWGAPKQMTWAFYAACCDEAYAVLGPEWTGVDAKAPNGFDLELLQSDLKELAA